MILDFLRRRGLPLAAATLIAAAVQASDAATPLGVPGPGDGEGFRASVRLVPSRPSPPALHKKDPYPDMPDRDDSGYGICLEAADDTRFFYIVSLNMIREELPGYGEISSADFYFTSFYYGLIVGLHW